MEALKELGYNPEMHKEGISLSRGRGQCHMKIPNDQIAKVSGGYAYGDIEFEKTETGWKIHGDNSSVSRFSPNKLKQIYSERRLMKTIAQTGNYAMESRSVGQKGEIRLRLVEVG